MSICAGHCPHAADAASRPVTEGAEVAARQGVLSALRPDPSADHRHQATAGTGTAG